MKHAKKVMLVTRPDPLLNQYTELDSQIDNILSNKNMSNTEKLKHYQQTLNRFLITDTKMNKESSASRKKEDIIDKFCNNTPTTATVDKPELISTSPTMEDISPGLPYTQSVSTVANLSKKLAQLNMDEPAVINLNDPYDQEDMEFDENEKSYLLSRPPTEQGSLYKLNRSVSDFFSKLKRSPSSVKIDKWSRFS